MRVVLICPSNMLYMPYVNNYIKILKENNTDYTIINWDRFQIEDVNNEFKYRDKKIGHQRNYYDYFKYKKFIIKRLKEIKFDKLIIFGLQLSYFLKHYLLKNYKGKYIIDIRDYNKIIKFFNVKKLVDSSYFSVISSSGYKLWLPKCDKLVINHNTQIDRFEELRPFNIKFKEEKISVSYIGAIRDYDVNIAFISSLKNNNVNLYYHGEGDINEDIQNYLINNKIRNVTLTGRYSKEDEGELYLKSDLINVLRYDDGINNKTALPNRLYNSVIYGKPMIALTGTYIAELIKEYKLGLVLDSFDETENKINNYLKEFNRDQYEKGRVDFIKKVIKDNEHFKMKLNEFLSVQL